MLKILLSSAAVYFFFISLVNVILSNIKSLSTVRYGRGINVITHVISYSFYAIVVKQTANLPLSITILATAITNAIGVYASYVILDFIQKDKLWKLEVSIPSEYTKDLKEALKNIPSQYIEAGPKTIVNFYCETRKETSQVLKTAKRFGGKTFATENKLR